MARVRRTFTPEFKQDAVALVTRERKAVSEVARHLGIAGSLLQRWVEAMRDQERDGNPRKARAAEVAEVEALLNLPFSRVISPSLAARTAQLSDSPWLLY